MFRLVMAMLLALTVGWKVALGLTYNAGKDFKPVLVEFLARSAKAPYYRGRPAC